MPDDESFEDEVERRFQEGLRRSGRVGSTFIFAASRDTIRREVERERREAQEARIRDLQERELEQQLTAPPIEDEEPSVRPGTDPAPYHRAQLEAAFKFHAVGGKSIRWLSDHDVISRYRMTEAIKKGVRWDVEADRLVLPSGTRATSDGRLRLPN